MEVPISAMVEVPQISCPRELYQKQMGINVLQLACKRGKRQDIKIPFRNNSVLPYYIEFEVIESEESKNIVEMAVT